MAPSTGHSARDDKAPERERRYVLSVVVPTKNRAKYALGAVEQILGLDCPDLQLVIQDNSDDDALSQLCAPYLADERLVYNYSPGTLSFVDNFSEGVARATGEYVCLIGDDDGISRELIDVARWASKNGVHAVKPGLQAVYLWPGAGLPGEADDGQLAIQRISGGVRRVQTRRELLKLLHNGCQEYLERDLAKLYHGLIKRSDLEAVRDAAGHYFGGLSPDIYAAVSLSTLIGEVVCLDYPLTISGICKTSGSADSATGRHTGKLEDAPHFVGHDSYDWAPEVPPFYSVATIWADSSLAALRELDRTDLVGEFDVAALAGHCLRQFPEFADLVTGHYHEMAASHGVGRLRANLQLIAARAQVTSVTLAGKVWRKLRGSGRVVVKRSGVPDIAAAATELSSYLESQAQAIGPHLEALERLSRVGAEPQ